jgi:S1-C subfamily serine protease
MLCWSHMIRLKTSALAIALVLAALVLAASTAFGLPGSALSGTRSAKTGVVVVNTTLAYGGVAAGTGIVLTPTGNVLTNNHVIRGARSIRVTDVSTGRAYSATVVGYSVSKDIALLHLRNAHGLQTALMGNSSTLAIGGRVTAVGNAGGTGRLTTKAGTVTGIGRSITIGDEDGSSTRLTGLIETSAPLRPGDSGGPILSAGRVVGVDAAASASVQYPGGSGEGFAIPINSALVVARQVEAGNRSSTVHVGPTAFLGVSIGRSGGARGVLVEGVASGSPADRAGVDVGAVITSFAGKRVTSPTSLKGLVLQTVPGRTVQLTWIDPYAGATSASVRLAAGPPQ